MGKNFDVPQGCDSKEIMRRIEELQDRIEDSRKLIG
jgi:hypothetical protein